MNSFINYSNHPSTTWSKEQIDAALCLGNKIIDIPFPDVSPVCTKEEIDSLAESEALRIMKTDPETVMCQGEFSLCFNIVERLKHRGVRVVSGCSERNSTMIDGKKISRFTFRQFREY